MRILSRKGLEALRFELRKELAVEVAAGMAEEWNRTLEEREAVARSAGFDEGQALGRKIKGGEALGEFAYWILKGRTDSLRDQLRTDYALAMIEGLEDKTETFDTFIKHMGESETLEDGTMQGVIDQAKERIAKREALLGEGLDPGTVAFGLAEEDDE